MTLDDNTPAYRLVTISAKLIDAQYRDGYRDAYRIALADLLAACVDILHPGEPLEMTGEQAYAMIGEAARRLLVANNDALANDYPDQEPA